MEQIVIKNKKLLRFIFKPEYLWAELKRRKLKKKHKPNNANFGLFTSLKNSSIGKNVFISHHVDLLNSYLGDYSYINSDTSLINTTVGKFCSIGSNVKFGLGKHPTDFVSTHPVFYANNKPYKTFANKVYFKEHDDIIIGNDVWVSRDVIIMGGVKIADGAIIAAGAIVTKDVPPYAIVGGVPAKILKYRFPEEVIGEISKSKWWNKSDAWLQKNYLLFHKIKDFLNADLSDQDNS